jgi:hypothetical protein
MSTPPFRRYTRRDRTSARDQNALRQRVEDAARSAPPSGGGLHALSRAGAQILVSDVAGPVWLRIDGGPAGTDRYESWTEVIDDGSGNFGPVGDDGLAGSPDLPAWLVAGAAPAVGDVILAWWSEGRESLLFEGPPPASGVGVGVFGERNGGSPLGPETTVNFIEGANIALTVADDAPNARLNVTVATAATLAVAATGGLGSEYQDAWAADQNDYALPAGTVYLNVDPTANLKLTGVANGAANRLLAVVNRSPSHTLTLKHQDAGSAAGNRFLLPAGSQWVLGPGDGIWLYYSGTDSRWYGIETETAPGLASPLTTKGDVWVYSTTDTRLAVGTNGQVLTADSTQATGLKWAATAAAFSGARATRTASTSSGPGTSLSGTVAFDAEDYDTSSYHDTVTNNSRLTAPSTGKYRIGAFFGGNVGGVVSYNVLVTLRKNGTTLLAAARYQSSSAGEDGDLCLAADVPLNSGDYFEVTWNFSSSGSTTFTVAASTSAWVEKRD